jgi:Ca2+-binding EF-hand superfamily protein
MATPQILDPQGRGYIPEETMAQILTSNEWPFRDKELEEFMRVAKDPDTGMINYTDYVTMLTASHS